MYMTVAEFKQKASAVGLKIKERNFRYGSKRAYLLVDRSGEQVWSDTMTGLRDQAVNGNFSRFGL